MNKINVEKYMLNIFKLGSLSLFLVALSLFMSCKNTSMDAMMENYNKNFLPSEEVFWIHENIEKATMSFEDYELDDEYIIEQGSGLFIIGGPRDCDRYTWFLDREIKSGNQVLELLIRKKTGMFIDPAPLYPVGEHTLLLQCRKNGVVKEWDAKLVIK